MVVLGGGAVSYERGAPVPPDLNLNLSPSHKPNPKPETMEARNLLSRAARTLDTRTKLQAKS